MPRRAAWLVAGLIAGSAVLAGVEIARRNGAVPVPPGSSVRGDLAGGDADRYRFALAAADVLVLEVEQHGVDLRLVLTTPGGREALTVDSPNGDDGLEVLVWQAEVTGDHGVELRAAEDEPGGRYVLRVAGAGPADPAAVLRAAGARAHGRGDDRRRSGALHEALSEYRRAAALAFRAGDRRAAARAMQRTAELEGRLGDGAAELRAYRGAIEHAEAAGAADDLALLHFAAGLAHARRGEGDRALTAFAAARRSFARLGDRPRLARAWNRTAYQHLLAGETIDAVAGYRRALELWRDLGEVADQATVLNNLGEVYLRLGDTRLAQDCFEEALTLRRRTRDRRGEAITLTSLGTVYRRQGRIDPARRSFSRALALQRRSGDRDKAANTLIGLGLTDLRDGRVPAARRAFREALGLAGEIGDLRTRGYALANLGEAEEAAGPARTGAALGHYRRALGIFRRLGDEYGEATACYLLARAERRRGRLTDARAWIERALARVESVRAGTGAPELQASYLAAKQEYYELAIEVLIDLDASDPGAGWDGLALAASERRRARSLLDGLAEARARLDRRVEPHLVERVRGLRERMVSLELRRLSSAGEAGGATDDDGVERALRQATAAYREARSALDRSSPGYADLTFPRPPGVAEIQHRILDRDSVLLEYALGSERSHLWLVTSETLESHVLPARGRLEPLARRAHRLLADSQKPSDRRQLELVLAKLAEELLGPVAGRLDGRRLVVVPDGALQYLPFAALPDPRTADGGEPKPLVAGREVVVVPSAGVVEVLRRTAAARPRPPGTLAVLADPVFDADDPRLAGLSRTAVVPAADRSPWTPPDGWSRLPFSAHEAAALLALVDEEERLAALGFDASVETVRSGVLARYAILHFATHGRVNAEQPELSALVLSRFGADGRPRPGLLFAHQLYDLHLPADLVVLSACHTALGREVRGEGLLSLTRGFLHAGASRVVVSLWSVDDRAATELMGRFYRAMLIRGESPSEALRTAQTAMWRQPRWREPYYWAGFVLQGEWL